MKDLVLRPRELGLLVAWLEQPRRHSNVAVVVGEPGSGKTALLQQLHTEATLSGANRRLRDQEHRLFYADDCEATDLTFDRAASGEPVLAAISMRADTLLHPHLTGLASRAVVVPLRPLGPDRMRQYGEWLAPGARGVPADVEPACGNPGLLRWSLQSKLEGVGNGWAGPVGIPHLARLSQGALLFLRGASVIGAAFDPDLALTLSRRAPYELTTLLEECYWAGLVDDEPPRLVRFRSPWVAQALYRSVPSVVRRRLHRDIAGWMLAAGDLARAADHYAVAGIPSDEAIATLHRVAIDARDDVPADAARLLETAIQLGGPNHRQRDQLVSDLVRTRITAGQLAAATSLATELINRGATGPAARAAVISLADALMMEGRLDESIESLQALAQQRSLDPALGMRIAAEMSWRMVLNGDLEPGTKLAEQTLAQAIALRNPLVTAICLGAKAQAAYYAGDLGIAVDLSREALASSDDSGEELTRHRARYDLAWYLMHADDLEGAARMFRVGQDRGGASPDQWFLPLYQSGLGICHFYAGRWDNAEDELRTSLKWRDTTGIEWDVAGSVSILSSLLTRQGRLDEADDVLGRGPVKRSNVPHFSSDSLLWARGLWLEARGDPNAAIENLLESMDSIRRSGAVVRLRWLAPDLARLCAETRQPGAAEDAAIQLQVVAGRARSAQILGVSELTFSYLLGDPERARKAVKSLQLAGRPVDTAAAHEQVAALTIDDNRADALGHLNAALTTYRRISAVTDIKRLLSRFSAYGLKQPPIDRPDSGWLALSDREQTVARLVGSGATNAEIAKRLNISRRTVETHVAHVFEKSGLHRRAQVSGWLSHEAHPGAVD